jgi:hypothetical protein
MGIRAVAALEAEGCWDTRGGRPTGSAATGAGRGGWGGLFQPKRETETNRGELSASIRWRALTRAGGWRSARVRLDPPHEGRPTLRRRPRPQSLIQPPLSPAEKTRAFGAAGPATCWSPLGIREGARPKARETAGISAIARGPPDQSPRSQTGWRSGQSSANPSLRPNSLI